MDKERLYERVHSMITSSTKDPKYISISTVKVADLFGVKHNEVEQGLQDLVNEGRLKKLKMTDPPHFDMYLLP
ncbi:hypothetical protein [Neobacillus sp. D3-1R]|uniref:hypothetical protein n=1 Tax=Neobacillus sp. D3-1R TaxID=3445778 RepID=UPI003F9F78C4